MIILLLLLIITSLAIRLPMIVQRPFVGYYQNEDATSHLVVTAKAIATRSVSDHHFLPIFTTSQQDRWIDNLPGSCVATAEGDMIYGSFPPLSFAITGILGGACSELLTPPGIRILALSIGLLATAGLFLVTREMAKCLGAERYTEIGLLCATAYALAPESLNSYCISLWAQQFNEVWIIFFIWCIQKRWHVAAVAFLAIACLTEWSAYVAAGGAVCYALVTLWKRGQDGAKILAVSVVTPLIALAIMLTWFGSKLNLSEYFSALTHRAETRAFDIFSFARLAVYTAASLGGLSMLLWRSKTIWKTLRRQAGEYPKQVAFPLAVIGASLLENVILSEHAKTYSYDRLKTVSFLCLLLAWMFSKEIQLFTKDRLKDTAIICTISLLAYLGWRQPLRDWRNPIYNYSKRLGQNIRRDCKKDSHFLPAYDGLVRGDLIYYADRNIVERFSEKSLAVGVTFPIPNIKRNGKPISILHYSFQRDGSSVRVLRNDLTSTESRNASWGAIIVPENRYFGWKWFLFMDIMNAGHPNPNAVDRGIGMTEQQIDNAKTSWKRDGFAIDR